MEQRERRTEHVRGRGVRNKATDGDGERGEEEQRAARPALPSAASDASSLGSFSPPICIGADLLTEALTGVASYCTGKQKQQCRNPPTYLEHSHLHSQAKTRRW